MVAGPLARSCRRKPSCSARLRIARAGWNRCGERSVPSRAKQSDMVTTLGFGDPRFLASDPALRAADDFVARLDGGNASLFHALISSDLAACLIMCPEPLLLARCRIHIS